MRALGYFRAKDGGASPSQLEEAFLAYCDVNLHQPVETFGDADRGEDEDYPAYSRLLAYMLESGSGFLIVVPDATHLGHDLESVVRSVVELEEAGAKVTCDDEDLPDPFQNALRRLGVKGVSQTRSERIKEAMIQRALKGKGLGRPPYGYRNGPDGTLEVVREEASVVELIYRLYTKQGLGLRLIAQHINERAIKTRRGGSWNMVSLRDILRNPTYTGTYTRFGFRLPRNHEAIIEPEVFREAQSQTRARRPVGRVANAEPFLLSGLVYCGACGNKMMGVTRRQTWRRKDGRRARGVYRYYQCQSRNNLSVCDYHTWRASKLEGTVIAQLRAALRGLPSSSDGEASRPEVPSTTWEPRLKNAERRLVEAVRRVARGDLAPQGLAEHLADLDEVRQDAEREARPSDAETTLAEWESLTFKERQDFLSERVSRVVVGDDSVEIVV